MDDIREQLAPHKKILILGFGREGQSTYTFIRGYDKSRVLTIADANEAVRENALVKNDPNVRFQTGTEYLAGLSDFDCIIKTPGISLPETVIESLGERLTSQADIFLKTFSFQTIGITGTKGKSSVSQVIKKKIC